MLGQLLLVVDIHHDSHWTTKFIIILVGYLSNVLGRGAIFNMGKLVLSNLEVVIAPFPFSFIQICGT